MFENSSDCLGVGREKYSQHRYIQADTVFTNVSIPISEGVIVLDESENIVQVLDSKSFAQMYVGIVPERYAGAIVPGFINAHAHLELSHLKSKSKPKKGLVRFLQDMMLLRNQFKTEEMLEEMYLADEEMFKNGIVAVADISNHSLSAQVKKNSSIYYHTFIETMGFSPQMAQSRFMDACAIATEFADMPHHIVPHAPYSVSKELFAHILSKQSSHCSIHNQECEAENRFFQLKEGDFIDFYQTLGLDISHFQATNKSSLGTFLPLINPQSKTLLVHNTFTSAADIHEVLQHHSNLYWCLCPNANLYIEDRLPPLELLMDKGLKLLIGTDSLASNHILSIADEMYVLQQNFEVSFEQLLQMATKNGAEFLGIENQFGTIEPGKSPGLILMDVQNGRMQSPMVKRLV